MTPNKESWLPCEVVTAARDELLLLLPATSDLLGMLVGSRADHVELCHRGVRVRLILEASAMVEQSVTEEVRARVRAGALVRLCDRTGHSIVIADQDIAWVRDRPRSDERCPGVTMSGPHVGVLTTAFETVWRDALRVGRAPDPLDRGTVSPVLEALISGSTDDAAARGLRMSVRTYRREVAKIMQTLGAKSRFEAGFRAALTRRR